MPSGRSAAAGSVSRIVADTNVYISALNFAGTADEVLALGRAGAIEVFISPPILEEIETVLVRKFRWAAPRVREAVRAIRRFAVLVNPGVEEINEDESIQHDLQPPQLITQLVRTGVEGGHEPLLGPSEDRVDEARVSFPGGAWSRDGARHLGSEREVLPQAIPNTCGHRDLPGRRFLL